MQRRSPSYSDGKVWDDPTRCPFCGGELADGGPAFVDHLAEATPCAARFDRWRDRVADDIAGEWTG